MSSLRILCCLCRLLISLKMFVSNSLCCSWYYISYLIYSSFLSHFYCTILTKIHSIDYSYVIIGVVISFFIFIFVNISNYYLYFYLYFYLYHMLIFFLLYFSFLILFLLDFLILNDFELFFKNVYFFS